MRATRARGALAAALVGLSLGLVGYSAFLQRAAAATAEATIDLKAEISEAPAAVDAEAIAAPAGALEAEGDASLARRLDIEALRRRNSDVLCWMTIPGTAIDSYVMLEPSAGSYRYDRKDIDGGYAVCGSYTVTATADGRRDAHMVVLGHHMSGAGGEWQFSNLPERYWTWAAASEHPYCYLYWPDRAERWVAWAAAQLDASDMCYLTPYALGSDDYAGLLAHLKERSLWSRELTVTRDVPTLVTSTCHKMGSESGRFVVAWAPDATHRYEGDTTRTLADELGLARWEGRAPSWTTGYLEGV